MSAKIEEGVGTNPLSILGEALESAVETFEEATTNARASAKMAATKVQVIFSFGVYKVAYGISYGLVFGGIFVKELLPESNSLRRGFEEGAGAAFDAAASRKVEASSASVRSIRSIPVKKKSGAAKQKLRIGAR